MLPPEVTKSHIYHRKKPKKNPKQTKNPSPTTK